jgi:hypothetical protein
MASYSTIPRAKAALKALIEARPGLTGVQIGWDRRAGPQTVAEQIYMFDTIEHSRAWIMLGRNKIDEEYVLQVVVDTFGSGEDPTATEERLWELVSEIERAVLENLQLTSTVREAKPDGVLSQLAPTDEGWIASATARIRCKART